MGTTRWGGVVAAVLTALLVGGCGNSGADAARTTAWAGQLCGAYLSFSDAIAAAAPKAGAARHDQQVQQLSTFTGAAVTAAHTALAEIAAAGVPDGADATAAATVAAKFTQRLTTIESTFTTAKVQIEAAGDRAALERAVAPLQSLSHLPDPTADLVASADLRRAVDAAPNCQKLRPSGG